MGILMFIKKVYVTHGYQIHRQKSTEPKPGFSYAVSLSLVKKRLITLIRSLDHKTSVH